MTPLDYAREAGQAQGVVFDDAVVLQETNNVVVWLRPAPVVAKVGRWSHSRDGLLREHAVAAHLARENAPVATPVGTPMVDDESSMVATLWHRIEPIDGVLVEDTGDIAACLRSVHDSLAAVPIELPDYGMWLDLAAATLHDDAAMHRLDAAERELLRARFADLRPQLDDAELPVQPIHGEPHTNNFILSANGLHLLDFETVCVGPIEWDLASLPAEVAASFDVDARLVELFRTLNSIRVATWCCASSDESMHAHGRHHIDAVRASST